MMKYIIVVTISMSLFNCRETIKKEIIPTGPLPEFSLLLTDSTTYLNTKNIPSGKPTVVFFFNPDCPYCRALTKELTLNMKTLKEIQFYLVTNFPFSELISFSNKFKLGTFTNIVVAQDYKSFMLNYFRILGVPYLAIYDKNKMLKQVVSGMVSTDVIKAIATS